MPAGFEILELPYSWVSRFIDLLPKHLKLTLRQCSKDMLKLVDSNPSHSLRCCLRGPGLGRHQVALQLCCQHMVCLDVSCASASPSFSCQGLSLPSLKHLVARADQSDWLFAIAAAVAPKHIQRLTLWCCHACIGQDIPKDCLQRFTADPGDHLCQFAEEHLAAGLQHLELWGGHLYLGYGGSPCQMGSFLQSCRHLRSLKMSRFQDADSASVEAASTGLAYLAHLSRLTLLEFTCAYVALDIRHVHAFGLNHLTALQDLNLTCDRLAVQGFSWLPTCRGMTRLSITHTWSDSAIDLIAQLPDLRELTLLDMPVTNRDLQPLTACRHLTSLATDALQLYPRATGAQQESAAQAAPDAAADTAADSAEPTVLLHTSPSGAPVEGASAATQRAAPDMDCSLGCLLPLRRLDVGNMAYLICLAPVSTLTPNITELRDSTWEGATFWKRPVDSEGAESVDALAGLLQLRVLDVDLYTLDRHAGHLASLTGLSNLQELRIEAVGQRLRATNNLSAGLPEMPYLTKLLIYTQEAVESANWRMTYDSEEDFLLWRQQRQLCQLAIKGSTLLGGFLSHTDIRMQLCTRLPLLQRICLQDCPDLSSLQLAELVALKPAPTITVQGCSPVTDRDCCIMSLSSGGAVCVDFSL